MRKVRNFTDTIFGAFELSASWECHNISTSKTRTKLRSCEAIMSLDLKMKWEWICGRNLTEMLLEVRREKNVWFGWDEGKILSRCTWDDDIIWDWIFCYEKSNLCCSSISTLQPYNFTPWQVSDPQHIQVPLIKSPGYVVGARGSKG